MCRLGNEGCINSRGGDDGMNRMYRVGRMIEVAIKIEGA